MPGLESLFLRTFFKEHLWATASVFPQKSSIIDIWHGSKYRGSCTKVYCKKSALTNFGKFAEKHVIESLEEDISGTGVFLWILRNY